MSIGSKIDRTLITAIRVAAAISSIAIALTAALDLSGGIRYRKETEHQGEQPIDDGTIVVNIQNRAISDWGDRRLISVSEWGPPFDIMIFAHDHPGANHRTAQLRDVTISAGDVVLARLDDVDPLPMRGIGYHPEERGFLFQREAFSASPRRISVAGWVRFVDDSGTTDIPIQRTFALAEFTELVIGPWSQRWEASGSSPD